LRSRCKNHTRRHWRFSPQLKAKAIELTHGSGKQEDDLAPSTISSQEHTDSRSSAGFRWLSASGSRTNLVLGLRHSGRKMRAVVRTRDCRWAAGAASFESFRCSLADCCSHSLILSHPLVMSAVSVASIWLDPSVEVAPFGVIASNMRGGLAVTLYPSWTYRSEDVPRKDTSHGQPTAHVGSDHSERGDLNGWIEPNERDRKRLT